MSLPELLTQQALSLDPEDRRSLAELLRRSLDEEKFQTPEVADAWASEITSRIAAYERGELASDDADAVLDRIESRLQEKRAHSKRPN